MVVRCIGFSIGLHCDNQPSSTHTERQQTSYECRPDGPSTMPFPPLLWLFGLTGLRQLLQHVGLKVLNVGRKLGQTLAHR